MKVIENSNPTPFARIPTLIVALSLVALSLLAGCATRGYVRNQVGVSAEQLGERIDQNQQDVSEVQDRAAAIEDDVELQAGRLEETQTALDDTRTELAETHTLAEQSMESAERAGATAETADTRSSALERLFGSRNQYQAEAVHEVHFGFDSATLQPESTMALEDVGQLVEQDPNTMVVLEGYTDAVGEADYNVRLAERRVEAVKRHLVVTLGVPVYRIHTFSFGEDNPLHDNGTASNAENRVVRLTVMAPTGERAFSASNQ